MDFYHWWRRATRRKPCREMRSPTPCRSNLLPFLVFVATIFGCLTLIFVLEARLRPAIATLAEVEAKSHFTEVIDQAILEDLTQRGTGYEDFVTIQRDGDGNIRALTTNMAAMNLLRAELENRVFDAIGEIDVTTIAIPLGSLFGTELLWGRGPDITARSVSVGILNTEFVSEFTEAGINQTSHRIYLDIKTPLTIMIASGTIQTEISTYLCVAETIIVGGVPNSYLQLQ